MFYDERIENAKGKIARNSIIITLVISVLIGGLKIAEQLKGTKDVVEWFYKPFPLATPLLIYIAMIICPLILLLVGGILRLIKGKDERASAQISRYYSKASIWAMKIIFAVLSIITSFISISNNLFSSSTVFENIMRLAYSNYYDVIQTSFFVVTVYVVYSFRKNHIYLNYSIIDSENYYKKVIKNIGKLSIYFLVYFALSIASFFVIVMRTSPITSYNELFFPWIIDTFAFYIVLFIEILLLYFFCSFLEKCSYKNESYISKAPIIISLVVLGIFAIYSVFSIISSKLFQSGAANESIPLLEIMSPLETFIKLYLLLFLTYFEYELRRNYRIPLFSKATTGIIIVSLTNLIRSRFVSSFIMVSHRLFDKPYGKLSVILEISSAIGLISTILIATFLTVMIFALTKEKLIGKAHKFVPIIFFALIGTDLYINTQYSAESLVNVEIYQTAKNVLSLLYFLFVVASVRKSQKNPVNSESPEDTIEETI